MNRRFFISSVLGVLFAAIACAATQRDRPPTAPDNLAAAAVAELPGAAVLDGDGTIWHVQTAGQVVVAHREREIAAYRRNGTLPVARKSSATVPDAYLAGDLVVVAMAKPDGTVYSIIALEAESLKERWRVVVPWAAQRLLWAAASGSLLAVQLRAKEGSHLVAYDARSGKMVWEQPVDHDEGKTAGRALLASTLGHIVGVESRDGSRPWALDEFANEWATSTKWAVYSSENGLTLIDPKMGTTVSKSPIPMNPHTGKLTIDEQGVYVARWGSAIQITALGVPSLEPRWERTLETPSIVTALQPGHEHLFACIHPGTLAAWDKRTGELVFLQGFPRCDMLALFGDPPDEVVLAADSSLVRFRPTRNLDDQPRATLHGTVRDLWGRPLAGSTVLLGLTLTKSDEHGRFHGVVTLSGVVCAYAMGPRSYVSDRQCFRASSGTHRVALTSYERDDNY